MWNVMNKLFTAYLNVNWKIEQKNFSGAKISGEIFFFCILGVKEIQFPLSLILKKLIKFSVRLTQNEIRDEPRDILLETNVNEGKLSFAMFFCDTNDI